MDDNGNGKHSLSPTSLAVEQLLETVFGDAPVLTLEEHDQKN